MIASAAAVPDVAGRVSRWPTWFAVTVLCLMLASRISAVLQSGEPGQVPFTVALLVIPLTYAFPGPRRLLNRYRWPVLAVQGALTWVPFAVFGAGWQVGIDGLLAALVLLMIGGRVSWLLAGLLLAAEITVRAAVTGLPPLPTWFSALYVVSYYVDDALVFFGMVRLAQIVGEAEDARHQAADMAIAQERLLAARALQEAVGDRLADLAATATAVRRALSVDPAGARAQIAAGGVTAREAVARARAVTVGGRGRPGQELAEPGSGGAAIGARLAWAVLLTVLLMFAVENGATSSTPATERG
jgi:hypothetical protein